MAEIAADQSTLDKFRNSVRDFKARYAVLASNSYGAQIARTGDNELIAEYGQTLARMRSVNNTIDSVMNAYQGVRNFVGLGALPLVPLAVIAGITVTVVASMKTIDAFMLKAGVRQIQRENPSLTFEQAAAQYNRANRSVFGEALDTAKLAMLLGAAVLAYLWMR